MNLAFLQDFSSIGLLLLGAATCAGLELRADSGGGPRYPHLSRWLALGALTLAFLAAVGFWRSSLGPAPPDVEHGSFLVDRFALFFYAAAPAAAAAVLLCGADLESELELHQPMYHSLVLVATAGVLLTASGADLATLLVGLALVVLPMGLASALRKTDPGGLRAAVRGLALSATLLAAFAAGEAILAGLGHATQLSRLVALPPSPLLGVGALLVVVGAAGQLGVFPLIRWRALAGGAPLGPWLGALALASLAVAAALLRLLPGTLGSAASGWTLTLATIAAATLLLAPVMALRQRRLPAAVGYLLVAQAALLLVGLPEVGSPATAAVLYVALGLVPMATSALGLLGATRLSGAGDGLTALRGLASRSPLHAGLLALLLAALAGLPPMASFFARILVVEASMQAGLGWLAVAAVASEVVSALVALRWLMAILDVRAEGPQLVAPGRATLVGLALSATALAGFTVVLGPLMGIAARAALAPLAGP